MIKTRSLEIGLAINKVIEPITTVYPIMADKGATYPFAIYRRTGLSEELTKDIRTKGYLEYCTMDLVIASTKYRESIELAQQIKEKLEQTRGNIEGVKINSIEVLNCSENWSNDAYLQLFTLRIEIEK